MKQATAPHNSITFEHDHAWVWDPNSAFGEFDLDDLREYAGLIPYWFSNTDHLTAKGVIDRGYAKSGGAFCLWQGGHIDGIGVYTNDAGDPPLNPVVATSHGDELVYIYEYGLVGVLNVQTAEVSITRCD